MRSLNWLAAIVLLIAIVFICIAPSVDLPATVLPGIFLAIGFLVFSNVLSRKSLVVNARRGAARLLAFLSPAHELPSRRCLCLLC